MSNNNDNNILPMDNGNNEFIISEDNTVTESIPEDEKPVEDCVMEEDDVPIVSNWNTPVERRDITDRDTEKLRLMAAAIRNPEQDEVDIRDMIQMKPLITDDDDIDFKSDASAPVDSARNELPDTPELDYNAPMTEIDASAAMTDVLTEQHVDEPPIVFTKADIPPQPVNATESFVLKPESPQHMQTFKELELQAPEIAAIPTPAQTASANQSVPEPVQPEPSEQIKPSEPLEQPKSAEQIEPPIEQPKPQPVTPQTPEVSDIENQTVELNAALSELPKANAFIDNSDITIVADNDTTTTVTGDDAVTVTDDADTAEINEASANRHENVKDGLNTLTAMVAGGIFGPDVERKFSIEDLDIRVDSGDIAPQHIVIPNMNPKDLGQYVAETNPDILRDSLDKLLVNPNDELYKFMEAGIEELELNLASAQSYVQRMRMAAQQFNTQATAGHRLAYEQAFTDYAKTHPDGGEPSLSRAVKIKQKDGTIESVDDSFANRDILFERIGNNDVGRVIGASSTKVAAMLINGLRTVNLFNSGFHVHLSAPKLETLSRYYNANVEKMNEFGRIFGQFAYLPTGVEKRAALFDLFESLVVGSNLENWQEPGKLREAVSVLDYPVIAWAIASLMYPNGVDVEYICHNTKSDGSPCRHVEKARVDISSMRYNNWSKMNIDQIRYVVSRDKRTLEDLAGYRKTYGTMESSIISISTDDSWKVILTIPTVAEAETKQRAYISKMAASIQIDNLSKAESWFRSKYYFAFAPYIKKVRYFDEATKKSLDFEDADALENALDTLQLRDNISLPEVITSYINERTISHICFAHHPCPSCGKYPENAKDRLTPCDPEYAFFVWAIARLRR